MKKQSFREFVEKHYVELKKNNPKFPFLVRECSDVDPKLWARYGKSMFDIERYNRTKSVYNLLALFYADLCL